MSDTVLSSKEITAYFIKRQIKDINKTKKILKRRLTLGKLIWDQENPSYNKMIEELELLKKELNKKETNMETILETIAFMVITEDPGMDQTLLNNGFTREQLKKIQLWDAKASQDRKNAEKLGGVKQIFKARQTKWPIF